MDILSHALSGVAVGTIFLGIPSLNKRTKAGLLVVGGLGAVLPDTDALSLWSKFDATMGSFFGLTHSGKDIYSAKFWYSHHGIMHSLFACLLLAGLFAFLLRRFHPSVKSGMSHPILVLMFCLGFLLHLLEDMITPGGSWHGIHLLWPMDRFSGGYGYVWWWNNYDLFLIVLGIILINGIMAMGALAFRKNIRGLYLITFLMGLLLFVHQVKSRNLNFNDSGLTFSAHEKLSKGKQQQILGPTIYRWMDRFDKAIGINF